MTYRVLCAALTLYAVAAAHSLGASILGGAVEPWVVFRALVVGGLAVLALRAWADWTPTLAAIALALAYRIFRGADAGSGTEGVALVFVAFTAGQHWWRETRTERGRPSVAQEITALFLPPPRLPNVPIGLALDEARAELPRLERTDDPPTFEGCETYRSRGDHLVTLYVAEGVVRGVILNTETYRDTAARRHRKFRALMRAYAEGQRWVWLYDNGYAWAFRRSDAKVNAMYAFQDVFSVWTAGLVRVRASGAL